MGWLLQREVTVGIDDVRPGRAVVEVPLQIVRHVLEHIGDQTLGRRVAATLGSGDMEGKGQTFFYLDGLQLQGILEDSWYSTRAIHLGMEEEFRSERREILIRERMTEEGKQKLGSREMQEWDNWADDQLEGPAEKLELDRRLADYLAPRRRAYFEGVSFWKYLEKVAITARYVPRRLRLSISQTLGETAK